MKPTKFTFAIAFAIGAFAIISILIAADSIPLGVVTVINGTGGGGNMTNTSIPSISGGLVVASDTSGTQFQVTTNVDTIVVTGTFQVPITNQVLATDGSGNVTGLGTLDMSNGGLWTAPSILKGHKIYTSNWDINDLTFPLRLTYDTGQGDPGELVIDIAVTDTNDITGTISDFGLDLTTNGFQFSISQDINSSGPVYSVRADRAAGSTLMTFSDTQNFESFAVRTSQADDFTTLFNVNSPFPRANGNAFQVQNGGTNVFSVGYNGTIKTPITNQVLATDGSGNVVGGGNTLVSLPPASPQTAAFSTFPNIAQWLVATGDVTITSSSLAAGARLLLNIDNSQATNINVILPSGWRYVSGATTNILAASKIGLLSALSRASNDTNVVSLWSSE